MHDFFKIMDISYFSNDINKSTLMISEKNGNIKYISKSIGSIISDHYKKYIKFYPVDDYCYTTTDEALGLRIWDREKEICVYTYPQDSLRTHKYNENSILGAVKDNGINVYDLRMRYNINFYKLNSCKGLEWNGNNLISYNEESIHVYDIRKDNIPLVIDDCIIKNIFTINKNLWYVKFKDNRFFIKKQNLEYEIEAIGSNCYVFEEKEEYKFCCFANNKIHFYETNYQWSLEFDDIEKIDDLIFTEQNIYLFSDKQLYFREGNYEKLKKEVNLKR